MKYKDKITAFAYVTDRLSGAQNWNAKTCYSDRARLVGESKIPSNGCIGVEAIAPSILIDESLIISQYAVASGLSPSEQIYTARGSQSLGMHEQTAARAGVDPSKYWQTMLLQNLDYGK